MIRRSTDAALHNFIINMDSVSAAFGEHRKDLSPLLDFPKSYVLLDNGKDAASVFEWTAPRVWQAHTYFLPSARGKQGITDAKAMCRWMFDNGALVLWGQTPVHNRAARMFNRLIGAKSEGFDTHQISGEVEYFYITET